MAVSAVFRTGKIKCKGNDYVRRRIRKFARRSKKRQFRAEISLFLSKVYFFSVSLSSMFEEKLVMFPQTWFEVSKK